MDHDQGFVLRHDFFTLREKILLSQRLSVYN